ncbi:hypothetical protein J5N97_029613 [Dioscorea zingiberensis]|uniref:Man1/Src1-like C-terminal domain-containing protein n=1 Tax=Dioscorea zingiberensis TaxID=325984 RepID=A0A9D5H398_9LILI|nr:hypothetical protein J5N97_029613 [Dioscorea zingiberensis]
MSAAAKKRSKSRGRNRSPIDWVFSEPPSSLFPSREELVKLLFVVVIASSVAVAFHFTAGVLKRRYKPFCDSSESFLDLEPDFCEPCPDNGHCSNGELKCFHGYKKHGRRCLEDGSINQTAKELTEGLEDHVCDSYAQFLCGKVGQTWVPEADILNNLNENKLKKHVDSKDGTFEFGKSKAMENIERSLETRSHIFGYSSHFKILHTKAIPSHAFCSACHSGTKNLSAQTCQQNCISLSFVALASGSYRVNERSYGELKRRRSLLTRTEELYEQVCEILEDNATMVKNSKSGDEKWVVASWLRDHLLLPRERKDAKIWKKVEELILEDSPNKSISKLIKGESKNASWNGKESNKSTSGQQQLPPTEGVAGDSNPIDAIDTKVLKEHFQMVLFS